jgi:hypothetical protein
MKRFKILKVTNEVINSTSYTKSCVVENLETGEIISIDGKTSGELEAEIIKEIDNYDLIVDDWIIIKD